MHFNEYQEFLRHLEKSDLYAIQYFNNLDRLEEVLREPLAVARAKIDFVYVEKFDKFVGNYKNLEFKFLQKEEKLNDGWAIINDGTSIVQEGGLRVDVFYVGDQKGFNQNEYMVHILGLHQWEEEDYDIDYEPMEFCCGATAAGLLLGQGFIPYPMDLEYNEEESQ